MRRVPAETYAKMSNAISAFGMVRKHLVKTDGRSVNAILMTVMDNNVPETG